MEYAGDCSCNIYIHGCVNCIIIYSGTSRFIVANDDNCVDNVNKVIEIIKSTASQKLFISNFSMSNLLLPLLYCVKSISAVNSINKSTVCFFKFALKSEKIKSIILGTDDALVLAQNCQFKLGNNVKTFGLHISGNILNNPDRYTSVFKFVEQIKVKQFCLNIIYSKYDQDNLKNVIKKIFYHASKNIYIATCKLIFFHNNLVNIQIDTNTNISINSNNYIYAPKSFFVDILYQCAILKCCTINIYFTMSKQLYKQTPCMLLFSQLNHYSIIFRDIDFSSIADKIKKNINFHYFDFFKIYSEKIMIWTEKKYSINNTNINADYELVLLLLSLETDGEPMRISSDLLDRAGFYDNSELNILNQTNTHSNSSCSDIFNNDREDNTSVGLSDTFSNHEDIINDNNNYSDNESIGSIFSGLSNIFGDNSVNNHGQIIINTNSNYVTIRSEHHGVTHQLAEKIIKYHSGPFCDCDSCIRYRQKI
jgi:hypothetical protein